MLSFKLRSFFRRKANHFDRVSAPDSYVVALDGITVLAV